MPPKCDNVKERQIPEMGEVMDLFTIAMLASVLLTVLSTGVMYRHWSMAKPREAAEQKRYKRTERYSMTFSVASMVGIVFAAFCAAFGDRSTTQPLILFFVFWGLHVAAAILGYQARKPSESLAADNKGDTSA